MSLNPTRNSIVMSQRELADTYRPRDTDSTDQQIMLISAYGELSTFCQSAENNSELVELRGMALSALLIVDDVLDSFEAITNSKK